MFSSTLRGASLTYETLAGVSGSLGLIFVGFIRAFPLPNAKLKIGLTVCLVVLLGMTFLGLGLQLWDFLN
jgi:hypothetical protein